MLNRIKDGQKIKELEITEDETVLCIFYKVSWQNQTKDHLKSKNLKSKYYISFRIIFVLYE